MSNEILSMSKKDDYTPKEIDVSQIDLDILKKKTADLPGLIEYAHSLGGFSVVPTEQGVIKGQAMQAMSEQTQMQLDMILEQMRLLAQQAKRLKDRVNVSTDIYKAKIPFKPIIGTHYFLYRVSEEDLVLSLIGNEEWGSRNPIGDFVAEVRLLADHTWEVIKQADS